MPSVASASGLPVAAWLPTATYSGGVAMALAYDSRRATRDVDALFEPHGIVHDEALAVAVELGLPRRWLNEQPSSYVAPGGDSSASRRSTGWRWRLPSM
jgi:hypothetical protein